MMSNVSKITLSLLLSVILLSSCSREEKQEEKQAETFTGMQSIVLMTSRLSTGKHFSFPRPSVSLGVFVTASLSGKHTIAQTALDGISALMRFLTSQNLTEEKGYRVLRALGASLEININGYLNRSTDRPAALDSYLTTFKSNKTDAERELALLKKLKDTINNEARVQRKHVNELKHTIDRAVRDENYTIAGDRQQTLHTEQAKLDELDQRLDEHQDIMDLLKKLLMISEDRLLAIEKNREVLLAGLKVIEVPGIKSIGILEKRDRRGR